MTREYARNIIYMLSEEQFDKLSELIQKFNDENQKKDQLKGKNILTAKGALNKYANPKMIPDEKGAWERAVIEKYVERNNI